MSKNVVRKGLLIGFIVFLAGVAGAFGQEATDSAELNLKGEVPALVRIGFDQFSDGDDVDLGDLTEDVSQDITIRYLANVEFIVSVSSANGGQLVTSDSGGFRDNVPYDIGIPGGGSIEATDPNNTYTVFSGSRGAGSSTVTIETGGIDLDSLDLDAEVGNVWAVGEYEDTLTFTIESNE